ncbi:FAD-binding oxidoreductase [Kaustia mangrovi]|uniref:FAD-binding oxidoreductase n=1 Tax=Kaustia mangrovi TaxID=2593653 RepID=A0A7S8C2A9_9HYPH|nr:FAD-binding oxidoreductase [Kaustia mangrovi]QPC42079.1 FAD-binding oxidoreductase [Kaustia mangrovi]
MNTHKNRHPAPSDDTLARLAAVVGGPHALTAPEDMAAYLTEQRGLFGARAAMVLRPGSTEEVSAIMRIAHETGTAIVPQGGNTGLVGAQVPFEGGNEVILSLGRLNRIREVDAADNTMTVEAGCILANIQRAADEADRLFPLSLGSEGTCQIGGNLSTNAGGTGVLAYGNARDLVLGLEVVLADGRVWNGLRKLRKNNTGYDLKQLFLGAEGTLGIVTAAVLKLFPKPQDHATAFVAIPAPHSALDLLALANTMSGGGVVALEILPRIGLDFTIRHGGARDPLGEPHDWYVLIELAGGEEEGALQPLMEDILARAFEEGLVLDAAIAASGTQRRELWHIRDLMSEVQKPEGGSIKHDVSVPVSHIPAFLDEATAAVETLIPDARVVAFGHIGDGNIHFNVSQPVGADTQAFLARWDEVNRTVHDIVLGHGGSVSAEHGIGRLKRHIMPEIKDPLELEMMKGLKQLFDPEGILNPGKMLPD